jgi:putative transposase
MGIGHKRQLKQQSKQIPKQQSLFKTDWRHSQSYGGMLRRRRRGRGQRPLSTKDPLHLVLKVDRSRLRSKTLRSQKTSLLIHKVVKKYAARFRVKVEQISIQGDHCHLLIRAPRRSYYLHFFRVVAGQVAQRLQAASLLAAPVTDTPGGAKSRPGTQLWRLRPFSRVVRGFRAYQIVRAYIQLNEKEAQGTIPYQRLRLRGLSSSDWKLLWALT